MKDDTEEREKRAEAIGLFRYGLINDLVRPDDGDPSLTLFNSSSVSMATNDDWGADPQLINAGQRVSA